MRRPANRLDARVRLVWWTVCGIWSLVLTLAAWIGALVAHVTLLAPLAFTALAAGAATAGPALAYRRWRYEIRERDVFLARGLLYAMFALVPFDRIQWVENRQGPIDRMFGLTQLVLYTAAGKSGTIPGLATTDAETLREELSRVAGTTSV